MLVIGTDVEFGVYAQVFGNIEIGNGTKIGTMSVGFIDVSEGATVVGIQSRF